jgi:translation initiation factor 1
VTRPSRLIFTTDPEEARRLRQEAAESQLRDEPPASQTIAVTIDRRRRKGKSVTVASGFRLTPSSMEKIAKQLKQKCAAGGATTSTEIEIQGEHLEKVEQHLASLGYKVKGKR